MDGNALPIQRRPRAFAREGLGRRVAPFAAVAAIGLAGAAIPPQPELAAFLAAATGLCVVVVAAFALPWERLPRFLDSAPPLGFIFVVAVLRDGAGGADSGYASLYLLPVLWLALYGSAREVSISVIGVSIAIIAPMVLVGGDEYQSSEWRREAIMTAVAAIVGWVTYRNVDQLRVHRSEAELVQRTSRELIQVLSEERIVDVILEAVVMLTGASRKVRFSQFLEVGSDGWVEIRGHRGTPDEIGQFRYRLDRHPYLPAVIANREVVVGEMSVALARDLHAVSTAGGSGVAGLFVPTVDDGVVRGVVVVVGDARAIRPRTIERIVTVANIGSLALAHSEAHSQLIAENVTLLEVSETDALTGVANRRAWESRLAALEATASRGGGSVDVGVIDLDFFKQYNDSNGHGAGDQLLKSAAEAWSGVLRRGDLLARIGGEEFAFAVVDAQEMETGRLAERLRLAVPGGSTCSIGVARHRPGETIAETVARADVALYAAKADGRNRVRHAESGA